MSLPMKDEEMIEVSETELRVGDVIVDYTFANSWWVRLSGIRIRWRVTRVNCDGIHLHDEVLNFRTGMVPSSQNIIYRVERVEQISAPVTSVAQWNGKCSKCGKGTYSGFVKVEHEGGTCPGGISG